MGDYQENVALIRAAFGEGDEQAIQTLKEWCAIECINHNPRKKCNHCQRKICHASTEFGLFYICSYEDCYVSEAQMEVLKAYITKCGIRHKTTEVLLWDSIRYDGSSSATEVLLFYYLRNMEELLLRLKQVLLAKRKVFMDFARYAEDREWIGHIPDEITVKKWFLLAVELTLISLLKQGNEEALFMLLAFAKVGIMEDVQKKLVEAAKEDAPYAAIARRVIMYYVSNALRANAGAYVLSDAMMMYQAYMHHYKRQ